MSEFFPNLFTWMMALIGGALLGAVFFGGLWWTVKKGLHASNLGSIKIGTLFLSSFILRISLVVLGIFFISYGHWPRLVACLLGFIAVRILITRLQAKKTMPVDTQHAP
jgi:F1F0 ATPase subunit 2